MRHLDEYRDPRAVAAIVRRIAAAVTRRWTLMEVCGGQTHAILKFGIDELLPKEISLIHGPGCPVCVTPLELIDQSLQLARTPGVILCAYGDMLRVPGSDGDLLTARSRGGDVRIVQSPLEALALARETPDRTIAFFAVGFETTAPASAMAVIHAARLGIENFRVLAAHVLVPPALRVLLAAPESRIQGLLAPGHVCVITGHDGYRDLSAEFRVPVIVTGFEPLDLLTGVLACVQHLERGEPGVENRYERVVRANGNEAALRAMKEIFVVCDRAWRGMGTIPMSGLALSPAYARFDAARELVRIQLPVKEPDDCLSGLVLQGRIRPTECPQFGTRCTPERPLGATMVSSEGACAAYFHYGRSR
ncbi:MAG: hydrogenase formation protein HypD [Phycisphaerae bacterium]